MIRSFNITEVSGTTLLDYAMNSIQTDTAYTLPNYGDGSYSLCWRFANKSTGYRLIYTNYINQVITTSPIAFTPITDARSNIKVIKCGFTDLYSTYGIATADLTKNINLQIMSGATIVANYIFSPDTCNGNEMHAVDFLNAWGVWDRFFFRGRKDDENTFTSNVFKYNRVNYSTMTYEASEGSYHKFNVQGRDKITMNTGWLDENKNRKLKELLLTEVCLINNYPYIITSQEVKYKSVRFDKQVNYTIQFELAADTINNIR